MDRDGEELVAIVQGLDAAGVTLTVSNRSRHNVDRQRPSRSRIQVNSINRTEMPAPAADHGVDTMPAAMAGLQSVPVARRASVETTTGVDFTRVSKGSQICDDRYTSSYKLTHCQMTPSSPPEAVSEFPPQRREPCRNQGNFEIGGNGSAQWSFHSQQGSSQGFRQPSRCGQVRPSTSRIRQNGGSQIWRDKGSSHRYCNSKRDTEAFEQSLRKYPSMSPFRTASHDLIEKLIRYTQAKNSQEMSRSSKSVRSFHHQKSADTNDLQSKHQQTYTRRQDNNLPNNSGVQVGHIGRTRNFKLYSPMSDSRNLRNRETAFSTSYDYLKAGSPPDGRSNRSDGSPSPTGSKSPEDGRSPVRSPVRFGSPVGSKGPGSPGSPGRSRRPERPIRFERSVQDLSLSEMSKYIRNTVRQICNEKPVVLQVCPKLKNRYNEHKRVCPSKNQQTSELGENEEDGEAQASSSVLSRIIRSFSGWSAPLTDAGCQCNKTDCYCTRATQCAYDSEVSTSTVGCSCRTRTIEVKTSCSRDLSCDCARKNQEQAYYYKRIDEEISEWLKDVPVHSIECAESKQKRETAIKELRQTLKQLPDDEDFDENVRNEISSFIDDFPLWNPGEDEEDEIMFKNKLADKLIYKIVAVPRKPDRFREIVTKWVEDLDFEDDNEEIEMDVVIDNFVNKLKSLAAERPACDMKYTHILRKEINELLVQLPLNYDSEMFKRKAHQLTTEIVNLPRNIKLSGDTDSTSVFEENISKWICEHNLCRELKKDPKLIEGLANKLKSQGIDDEELIETMKELMFEFVDDVDTAIGILDEFVDELMKTVPSTVQKDNLYSTQSIIGHEYSKTKAKRFEQDELHEVIIDWISNLPGVSDLSPSKFEEITEDIVTMVQDSSIEGKEDLENNIFEYIVDTHLPIDLSVLHTHVDELMERLNVLPPSEDLIEQAKRDMIKDMFKIIDTSSMSEERQDELRKSALKLVHRKLTMMSSLNFLEDQDDVKEALLEDMSRIIDKLGGESQDELKNKLSSSLSTTFDKSFIRLGKDESDLKQTIEKNVRKAVDELPVSTIRKEGLMGQVNCTLCKHINKPLPPNVKNIINDNICNIFEKCPISEDRSLCERLKKTLFDVVGQHLDMLLPKPVCDFQCKIEKDVDMVIDRCPIDPGNKRQLKKCVQDIFTKNGDRPLSEEVITTIKEEVDCLCSDLRIPKEKKGILEKAVGASVSKNLNDALSSLSHDLNKLKKRLYDTMTNVIEKSPITRGVKTNLKSQLKSVLVRNLDSPLSDEEKDNILDEVSIILQADMPGEKRKGLTNKLSNKIDTFQRKEKSKDLAEIITKDVDQLVNRLSIDSDAKEDVKKDIKTVLLDTLYNPLTIDKQQKIKEDIINEIDEIDIPKNEKNYLKSNVAHAMTKELDELIAQGKDVPEIKTTLEETIGDEIKDSSISKDKQELLDHKLHDVLADNLVRDVTNEEKEATREKLTDIVDDLKIDKGKSEALKTQLLNDADKYFEKAAKDKIQTKELTAAVDESMNDNQRDFKLQNKILQGLENSIEDSSIPEEKKIELKTKLKNIAAKNLKIPLFGDATELTKPELKELENKTKQNILQGFENVIDAAPMPKEKKMELKKKLNELMLQYFKNQISDDVPVVLKEDMNQIIDEMYLPKAKKDKLKSELTSTVDDNMNDLRSKKKSSLKGVDDLKALDKETKMNIERGLENVIAEASLPREKKNELQKQLKDMTTKQFKSRLSDDVAVGMKDGIDEIIDEMNLPKYKRVKLKSELSATVDDNMSDMHRKIKNKDLNFPKHKSKELEKEVQVNIERGLQNVIDAAPIPKEKKMELMKKLKELMTPYFKNQLSDDVPVTLKEDMNQIIDEMNLPKDKKDKLKSEITATVDDNMNNLQNKTKPSQKEVDDLKALDKETKVNIERGLDNVIAEAPLPKEKKHELHKQLKDLTTKQFKSRLSDDVAVGLKDDMDEIIDEMNLPKDKKDKLKSELTATVDDNMSDMHKKIKDKDSNIPKNKSKGLEKEIQVNIVRGLQNVIDAAPISKEKKMELMKKLKELMTPYFKNQLSDDVPVTLKEDMNQIIDEMNLPKDKKDKLKSDITATVDDNMNNLQNKTKPSQKEVDDLKALDKETKENIERGLENVIAEAPLPKEKKNELQKQLKDLTTKQFKSRLSDDVAVGMKDDIDEIIDEMNLPKDKRGQLKRELNATVDDNMSDMHRKLKGKDPNFSETKLKEVEKETQANIIGGLENVINAAPISKEKKMELIKKLKELTAQHFKNRNFDDDQVALKDDMNQIIDEMNLPKDKKDKLKSELTATVDDNMSNFRSKTKPCQGVVDLKELDKETKVNIERGLENVIAEALLPKEKKMALMKKLKELMAQHFKNRLSDDDRVALKDDMNQILDEMNLPKDKKDKLKSELIATVDDNMDDLRSKTKSIQKRVDDLKALDKETKANIEQGLENVIAEAPLPKERKIEVKKKFKDLTTQQFKNQLSDDVAGGLKDDMDEIIDEINLPKDKKDKLKSQLNATVDDNMNNLRNKTKPSQKGVDDLKELDKETKVNIERGLENVIAEALLPKEKKMALMKKLKELMAQHFKNRLSDDDRVALKDDMNQILDEMNLPKDKKDKLKSDITATVDDNMDDLRSKTKSIQKRVDDLKALDKETKLNIERGLETVIAEAPLPKEKKIEVKKQIKNLTTKQFKNQLSDDVAVELKDDMDEIIDEMNLPKDKKTKLKSELNATVDDNMSNLRNKTKPSQKGVDDLKALDKETKVNIEQGLENVIAEAPLPKEKKMELMKKLKELMAQHFKNRLSDNDRVALKDDMNQILDEMNLPKDKKDKLKSDITATVDDNMDDLRSKTKSIQKRVDDLKALDKETKLNIERGLETVIAEAPLPKEKKIEVKKQIKNLTTKQFKNQLSDDVAVELKDDMDEIIDEMNLPKDKKTKLKSELNATVDDNMSNLRNKTKPSQKGVDDLKALDKETKVNIEQGLENVIAEAPLPKEKKMELMKKLKELMAQHFKNRLSDNDRVALKNDMNQILDEMNLPKDKKAKLKSDITATVDDNMDDLRSKTKSIQKRVDDLKALDKETKANIERGLDNVIAEAPLPKEKKIEVKKKIKDLTTQQFKNQLSDDVAGGLKDDMDEIIDEINLPIDKKDKLKSELNTTVDDNMSTFRSKTRPSQKGIDDLKALEKETKVNIERGLENVITEAPLPKEKKIEVKKKIKDLTTRQFKNQLSDDVAGGLKDDMDEIIDEINLPKDKKTKLKRELNATVDDNMSNLQSQTKPSQKGVGDLKALDKETKANIERGIDNVIAEAPLPKEKKIEVKKKIKDLTTRQFKNQLSDDVAGGLKDDMDEIIDEINLPKDKKTKLKSELNATVDDNMSNLRSQTKPSQKGVRDLKALDKETKANIERGIDNVIAEAPLPKEKKIEVKKKIKDLTTQQFKNQLSDDVAVGLKDDMDEIIDEINLPEDKKTKLKSELNATVDDNMSNLRNKTKPIQKGVDDLKALDKETKVNIERGLENVIAEAPLPKEKKIEVKKKIKNLTTQQFKNQLSDDVAGGLKDDMDEIIDEINLPKDKKDKLKSELNTTVDDNMRNLRSKTRPSQKGIDDLKALEEETKVNIERGLENVIAESPLPKEKKIEVKKKVKDSTTQQFKNQLSDDVAEGLKDDMDEIINEINLPKDKKTKLKSELNATVDDNMSNLRSKTRPSQKGVDDLKALEKETKVNIERGLENVIAEAPLPKEKKIEVKKKIKDLTTQQFKNQLSDDVAGGLKDNMDEIIDEINLPKDKKTKLKSELKATVDDNMSNLRSQTKPSQKGFGDLTALDKETKTNIERGLENVIAEAPLPKEKKIEVKKKIKNLTTQQFKNQLSDNVAGGLKDDMDEIIDEINLPRDKKDKLKSELNTTVDDNMRNLRSKTRPSQKRVNDLKALDKETKVNIERELEKVISEAPLPKEKKIEVKKKIKDLTTQQFKNQLSDDVAVGLKDDMDEIVDEMKLPKDKKDKLKSELNSTVDDNMSKMQRKIKDTDSNFSKTKSKEDLENDILADIIRGFENVIGVASMSKEEKMELMKKLKEMTKENLKNQLSDDVPVALKYDVNQIVDEINLPKDKKDKLKSELTATVDDYISDFRSKTKPSQKGVDDLKALDKETKGNIVRGLENAINEAPLPKEKKMELKKQFKDLTTQQFKSRLSEDVAVGLKDDMDEIIDEMNLPKHKKDKLKSEVNATVDDNMSKMQRKTKDADSIFSKTKSKEELENEILANIIRGFENVINAASIPKEERAELMKKLKNLTTQQFENQLSDDVVVGLKNNMNQIVDEMNLPKYKKDKLKSEVNATVDDNMSKMQRKMKDADSNFSKTKSYEELENDILANIIRGFENVIDAASVPKEEKIELMKKLKEMTKENLKKQLSDNVPVALKYGMNQIVDEMNLPKDKKDKLKSEFTATVDDNISDFRSKTKPSQKGVDDLKALDKETKGNIVRGLENAINEAPLPKEKKIEVKKKIKDLTTQQFKSRLSDDVAVGLKDDMNEIIDETNLPKDKKDELKGELTTTVDTNMRNFQRKMKDDDSHTKRRPGLLPIEETKKKDRILQGIEKVIEKSAIPENKKRKLSGVLQKIAADDLKKRLSNDVQDKGSTQVDNLKERLSNDSQDESSTQVDDINELKKITMSNILLGHKMAVAKAKIPTELRKYLKDRIKELTMEHFKKPLTDNTAQEIKDDVHKEIDDLNLPEDLKDQLELELDEAVDENMRNLLKKLEELNIKPVMRKISFKPPSGLKDIFDKFGINPSYQKQLEEEFNKLLKIARNGGDLEDARRKLIKKLMRDLNLSEEEASALADELLGKAREMALKDNLKDIFDKYGIDPSYKDKLAKEFNKLLEIARKGGDFEDARNKLIDKLMQDLNLPEEEASALADEMIDKARKMALNEHIRDIFDKYGIDPSYEDKLAKEFNKLLEIARKGGDFEDARNQLIKKLMQDLNLPKEEASALADEMIDKARKMALKEHLRDIFDEYGIDPNYEDKLAEEFNKLLEIASKGGDFEDARNKLINKLMQDLNLPEEEASALADEMIDKARKMALKEHLRDIFDKYGIDPSYEDKLAEEFNKLLEIARKGGDFEDARNKLINNLMQDLNLPEEEASALADEMIDKARKMALKEHLRDIFDKYGIDPSYEDKLVDEFNKLLEIARKGGDFEDARNKLINKLMQDLNLPEEEASALADEMIDKARKMALKEHLRDIFDKHGIDPSYEDKLVDEFNKLLEIARKGGDFEDARNKLINKLMQDLNLPEEEASALADEMIDKARKMALKEHLRDIVDKHGIDPSYEDELVGEFNKLLEIAQKDGDLEDAKVKLIKLLMRDLNLSEAEASTLADDLVARAREMALAGKITEAFTQAISDAVDQSTVAKADKPILKNKLLCKLKQILDKKPYIHKDDIGPLKEEVLKECNEIVDDSSISTDKKNKLKQLLKEQLDKAFEEYEDGEAESLADYKDKITKSIKKWMDSLPIHLDPKVAATVADNIASDILDRHKYLHAHPEAKSSEKDEIENLKYQVFRRMYRVVNPKAIPKIMERTPDLYKAIMKIKPPPQVPKRLPKPKDAFVKAGRDAVDEKTLPLEEDPLAQKQMKELKKVFAKSVDQAIVESSLSKPDKSSLKKRLLEDLGITSDDRKKAEKYDVGPSDAMDKSPAALEHKKKIRECVKTWLETLPIDLDPKTAATIADNLTNDILERQKYLKTHLEAVFTDEDEIENLMYQVFRRLKDIVDPEGIPDIMKRTEDLYNMIMNIKKELESQQEQGTSSKRRRYPSPQDWRKSTSAALSTGNINYSLGKLMAPTHGVGKQWSRNFDDAITEIPNLKIDDILNDILAIYDETGQIDVLPTTSRFIAGTSVYQGTKSKKQFEPKPVPKNKGKSCLSKIEKAFAYNNTTEQNSPFNPNKNQITEKEYVKILDNIITNWLDKAKVNIAPNEKNKIVGELVWDIVERQKYFQKFEIANATRSDVFEYLKLQVHRRLNTLVPLVELKRIVEGIGELTTKIEKVQIPKMVTVTNENVQIPQMVAPPKSPKSPPKSQPKSSIKLTVSKKNHTKEKENIQTTPSTAAETSTEEVPQTFDDDALESEMPNTEFSPRQASSQINTTGEEYVDEVTEFMESVIKPRNKVTESMEKVITPRNKVIESMDKVTESVKKVTKSVDKVTESIDKVTESVEKVTKPMDKFTESMDKITESTRTWLESVPINIEPDVQSEVINDLANDIIDRQKYLQVHPEKMISKNDEIENLRFQVFKRLNKVTDDESLIPDIDEIEKLYKMVNEQGTSSKRRRYPSSPQDWKKSISAALSTGNMNNSLRKLIPPTKDVRKQWSRNFDDAITKISKTNENLNEILATYDVSGQIDMLSTASRPIAGTSTYRGPTSKKQFLPKTVPKNKGISRLSKIEEAFAFNNTTKQNSPFNQNQITEKDYIKILNDFIKNWLVKAKVNIAPKEMNKIVGELVRDIVERQKYLQEYEITNASRSDDLEYLKLQVHRRLNSLVPAGELKTIVESMGELTAKIESVQKPQIVAAANENEQIPLIVAPPKTPPKSSIKSPVSKKKKTKQKKNIQTTPSNVVYSSTEEVQNNNETVDDDDFKHELSNTEFRPEQASTPTNTTGEDYVDKITESTRKWIESLPINLEPDVQSEVINDLANDITDRQKFLHIHPEKMISKNEEIENLRFQVFKRLDKVIDDESLIPDIDKIEELYKMINGDGRRKNLTAKEAQEFQDALPDEIAAILNDYNICCERRELLSSLTKELAKLGSSNADQDEIIENLTDAIKRITYLSDCDMCDDEAEDLAYKLLARTKKLIARIQQHKGAPVKRRDFRDAVMNDIGDVFRGCPMSEDKRRMMECQLAEDYAEDLGIPLQDSEVTMTGAGHYGMSFNGLTNFIDTWLSSIHTEDDDTKDESEINDMKKDMAYSLIHKIGEMNVDPEIFNDDALYEAIIRDELQNMLGDITIPDDEIEPLKEELISKVIEAKQRAHDEFAGQAYKRHLRDTISKVLPDQRNLSKEEQATMKTLKDQLADAYIDLQFSGTNESQREKLKRKIFNELNRFCRDYMNKVPCAPISSQKLNQDLYAALNAVSLPAKDSIRYEVEQARIREEINDWLKELPIQPQNPTELLARNKMVYVLAKKLFDIEIEGNDTDNDSKRAEIVKFLNRLPLETEEDLETLADTLIDKLIATEESRKYNASSYVTIDSFGNVSMNTPVCSKHKSLVDRRKASPGPSDSQMVCRRPTCKQPKPMPPCTLSPEDKDYLERIRRRTYLSPSCVRSLMKDNTPKTCPGVRPVDAGSQTTQRPLGYQRPRSPICRIADERTPRSCSGQPANAYSQRRWEPYAKDKSQRAPVCPVSQQKIVGPCPGSSRASHQCGRQLKRRTISSNNICDGNEEVQPELTTNKYYWNPNDKNSVEDSEIPQKARGNRGDPPLRHQTSPTVCDKIRISSGAQCSPPPCGRISLCKLQQQDIGSQRMPCDLNRPAPYSDPKSQRQPPSNPYGDPQSSFHQPYNCAPSPCMSPFGLNNQPSPSSSPFSKRDNECRIPKRDGLDHQDEMPCSSSRPFRKERVIELGSLDDLSNSRPKKRHNDANDWHFEEEEDDNFWCSPIRRVVLDEGIDDTVVMEREQREERIRCKCKERLIPKSQAGRAQPGNCPSHQFTQGNDVGQNLKKCAKCCGRHCPYPSYLYFRQ